MAQDATSSPAPFHTGLVTRGQAIAMLSGAAIMLSIAMGVRQTLGLFQTPVVQNLGIAAADFAMAIAVQNIVWGFTQPVAGAFVDRFGPRWIALAGCVIYIAGLVITAMATSAAMITLGAGVLIGIALSCTTQRHRRQHRRARGGAGAAQPGIRHRVGGRVDGHLLLPRRWASS